jgi:hypothetical protein
MPASAVAECAWEAYHSDKLHWYVPKDIRRIDIIKALAPSFMRNTIKKQMLGGLFGNKAD